VSEIQTGGVSDDPGRIIYELEQRLAAETKRTEQAQRYISDANEALNEKTAEIDRLQARLAEHGAEIDRLRLQIRESNAHYDRMRLEFNAAQQLRSEVQQLERLLDDARENLRDQEAAARAFDHHCEGMKAAYLAVIKTFVEARA
jgi:chromosome segregation ATPase